MAFLEFGHNLWEASKPKIVSKYNKLVSRFLRTKATPPFLWNACEEVLEFISETAHSTSSVNTAADFLPKLELKVTEKIRHIFREDVRKTNIEEKTSTSDVADGAQFFCSQTNDEVEIEEQTFKRKGQSRKKAEESVAKEQPSLMKPTIKEYTKIYGHTTSYYKNGNKENARIRVNQDVDPGQKYFKSQIFRPTR